MPALREAAPIEPAGRARTARDLRVDVEALLATEGYFKPVIDITGVDAPSGPLRIVVNPGPRTLVQAVDLDFVGDIADAGDERRRRVAFLRENWSLPAGSPFRDADWRRAKQLVLTALLAEDYPAARISESEALVDPDAAQARLAITYDSGPAFSFGDLVVSGLERHDPALVQRYNTIAPGTPYSLDKLLELQTALQNTPYFSSVLVDIDPEEAQNGRAPVRVRVREARAKRVGFGVGYSTNTGLRTEAAFEHRNFLDRAWHLMSGVRLEQRRQFAYADVFLPPSRKDYRDKFGVLAEASDIQGLKTARYAAAAVRSIERGPVETSYAVNLQRERRTVSGEQGPFNTALTLNVSRTYRAVDDAFDPRSGYVWNAQLGGATRLLISDRDFIRGYTRYQRFFPVQERDVLIVRGEIGVTVATSREGIPESFLFRAGGSESVRGYAYQSLGARERGAVVGGRYLATASVEYVHWIDERWGGAVFYDVGDAGDNRSDFRPRSGYGAGVRWKSPAGPLAFDVAYGQSERRLRGHFSVSVAF